MSTRTKSPPAKPAVENVLNRLQDVKTTANGWSARCPAHDDRKASLAIAVAEDGKILLHCHAGCPTEAVLSTVGLTLRDLMPSNNGRPNKSRIVKTYDYRDEAGNVVYQVVRYSDKTFAQRRPDGRGGWLWEMTGVRRVLYHLPELLAADPSQPVYVVEGEKDTDRLGSVGLVATTNSGGVGKWRPEYGKHLKGREVIILPDNDQKGREHAESVARALHGVAKSSKVLRLPGLPNKGDVSDWLDAGGTVDALRELASRTEDWIPDQQVDASTTPQATPRTREELLATVNGFLVSKYGGRVNVVRVEKIGSIRGRFGLITAEGHRIKIGGINRLRPVAAVREAIADHPDVRVLIPEHKKRWPLWTHSVIQLAEVKDTGSPFDHLGEILRKLVYKSNEGLNPYAGEPDHGVPRDRDWQLKKYPRFGYPHCCTLWGPNRTLYVSFHHLFDYMRDRNLMLRDSDLRDVLAEKGFQPVDLYARDGDRQIKRRAWASPPDFDLPDF